MRVLLLGGPVFLGHAVADATLARGHELTFFNRGQTNPELYPDVEKLRGNRDGGLGALTARDWDAVVDTCGYFPRLVRMSAELLEPHTGRYAFVSSVSVYGDFSGPVDESSPVGTLEDETVEEWGENGQNYGPLKALCERVVQDTYGERALIIRPGLIVGPFDPTGRFTYWPHRVARGGEVLAPGPPERRVQFIDVRDLAEWIVRLLEGEQGGVFNAAGTGTPWGDLVAGADVTWYHAPRATRLLGRPSALASSARRACGLSFSSRYVMRGPASEVAGPVTRRAARTPRARELASSSGCASSSRSRLYITSTVDTTATMLVKARSAAAEMKVVINLATGLEDADLGLVEGWFS